MALTLSDPPVPSDWIPQTPLSDPGEHAALLEAVEPTPTAVGEVVRTVIAHYRAAAEHLPESSSGDVNLRWVAAILATDQRRHPGLQLTEDRAIGTRLQGCCRDHSLLAVSILRHHGVPARTRVGFADYVLEGWHHDHVVVEMFDGTRWRRFDPELSPHTGPLPDPLDLETGSGAPFTTAAEAFHALRAGTLDPASYGGGPESSLGGESFVLSEVFWELAHRYGDELLLWDGWGAIPRPGKRLGEELLALLDGVAALLVAADAGDLKAERALYEQYLHDARLRPGAAVLQFSPVGGGPLRVDLSDGPQGI